MGGEGIKEKGILSFILYGPSRNEKNEKTAKTEGASVVGGRSEREKGQCF